MVPLTIGFLKGKSGKVDPEGIHPDWLFIMICNGDPQKKLYFLAFFGF